MKEKYFNSEEFIQHKQSLHKSVEEYNDISFYLTQIPNETGFTSDYEKYSNENLAQFVNTSVYNMNRNRYNKDLHNVNVKQTSLQIVRRASEEPIKYLIKYFNIPITEESVEILESIRNNISKFINTEKNLELRNINIIAKINPPNFIILYYKNELMEQLEVRVPTIKLEYSKYIFQYVSAGGNSSQQTIIDFNEKTIEATEKYIIEKLNGQKSVKYQRTLMTPKLREYIKKRDNFTCQLCGVSTREHSLILLEIDHIIPISKGGLSNESNLQTLCWKCNRNKSDKIY
ncbi:HNH endonuclease [Streptococcus uberis]|uniref:HNH endonuclease n=1 Tax=Streptococcus uberis TaxID=1349 RepID=UPI001FF5C84C|nr:HNH endonuclease [Streptococcus uberis]MCK1213383.1 HNH endonuclease [Streptococcus uberis]